ncbi:MAG: CYTH domain-containing protein [Dorea sp.]|jgi:adenylate cyclase|nr:CYTH domain-containing protein [Dorea sp.]
MEIERKYLIKNTPDNLSDFPCRIMEQGYLNTDPVIRIRKDNDNYELTYKSKGLMVREEYNLPLTKEAYGHLLSKIDGRLIKKRRYMLPLGKGLIAELDIFEGELAPLILAEVEFPDEDSAFSFIPPDWFGEDVTFSGKYHNSFLSQC